MIRWATYTALASLIALAGCGDADTTGTTFDAISGDVVLPDLPLSRGAAFPNGPAGDVLADFQASLCRGRCAALAACGTAPVDCSMACRAEIGADPGVTARFACEQAAACDATAACAQPISDDADCARLCGKIDGCAAFPDDAFGPDAASCVATCSGARVAAPDRVSAELACFEGRYDDNCARAGTGICEQDFGDDEQCSEICERLSTECNQIPGARFTTLGACLADCTSRPVLARLQLNTCSGTAGCERLDRCYLPTTEVPEICATFCPAWMTSCAAFGITAPVCDAACSGLLQGAPGFDLAAGTTCVEQAPMCVFGDALIACIAPEYAGCAAICEAVEACGLAPGQCQGFCPYLYALEPAAMPTIESCVTDAACNTIFSCFE